MIFFPKFWVKSKKIPKILIFAIRLRKKMSSMGKLLKLLKKLFNTIFKYFYYFLIFNLFFAFMLMVGLNKSILDLLE